MVSQKPCRPVCRFVRRADQRLLHYGRQHGRVEAEASGPGIEKHAAEKVDGKRKKHGLGETFRGCCNPVFAGGLIQCKKMMLFGLLEMASQNFTPPFFIFVKAFVLVWEPGSIWYRTAPPAPAASPADCPTERRSAPKETTQMDPATRGSIVLGKQGPKLAGQGARQR